MMVMNRFLPTDLKTLGEKYTLTNAQPEDTGVYVCKASNGVPPPEQAKIRLKVKGGPLAYIVLNTVSRLKGLHSSTQVLSLRLRRDEHRNLNRECGLYSTSHIFEIIIIIVIRFDLFHAFEKQQHVLKRLIRFEQACLTQKYCKNIFCSETVFFNFPRRLIKPTIKSENP